jgi:hypothetical protein
MECAGPPARYIDACCRSLRDSRPRFHQTDCGNWLLISPPIMLTMLWQPHCVRAKNLSAFRGGAMNGGKQVSALRKVLMVLWLVTVIIVSTLVGVLASGGWPGPEALAPAPFGGPRPLAQAAAFSIVLAFLSVFGPIIQNDPFSACLPRSSRPDYSFFWRLSVIKMYSAASALLAKNAGRSLAPTCARQIFRLSPSRW